MTITSIEDFETLVETTDIECKAAQGKSGEGEIPESIWETYSAKHPKDITAELMRLVRENMLEKHGETRASEYALPGRKYEPFTIVPGGFIGGNSPSSDSSQIGTDSPQMVSDYQKLHETLTKKLQQIGKYPFPVKLASMEVEKTIRLLCKDEWIDLRSLHLRLEGTKKRFKRIIFSGWFREATSGDIAGG